MNTVVDRDNGWRAMLKRARDLASKEASVKVGILVDAPAKDHDGESGPLTIAQVAALHEFGAPEANIPMRSFVRATVDEQRTEIAKLQHVVAGKCLAGTTTTGQGLDLIGAKVASMMIRKINSGIAPPLAQSTIDAKGSSKPLVDTGQLKSSITWQADL